MAVARLLGNSLVLLCFFSCPLLAQDQERRLADRLLNPSTNKVSQYGSQTFEPSEFQSGESYSTGEFRESKQDANTKSFNVLEFLGLKKANMDQEASEVGKQMDIDSAREATEAFESESFTVKKAEAVHKAAGAASKESPLAGREANPDAAVQGAIDQIAAGMKDNLTIDEIRELLNKKVAKPVVEKAE